MTSTRGLTAAPGNAFCGPTAIAAIVGVLPEEVERAVLKHREANPKPKPRNTAQPVKSMWAAEIEPVLAMFGWRVVETFQAKWRHECPTFATWQRRTKGLGTYVVLVTGHFVAVSGHWFVDTKHRSPIALRSAPHRRCRVVRTFRLEPLEA